MKIYFSVLVSVLLIVSSADAQIFKTNLNVIVRDELGNTVEGVTVKLYETADNYKSEKNPVAEGITDAKGVVKFKDQKAIAYYVLARKGDKDNAGGGEQTGKLEEHKFNKARIVIQ